jgi:hypothetical protein
MAPKCLVNGLWHYCIIALLFSHIKLSINNQNKLHLQCDFAYNPPHGDMLWAIIY